MTFCIGIRVRDGLVALADTQIVKGDEVSSKAKLSQLDHDDRPTFLMTSGLRSIRDKAYTRLEEQLAVVDPPHGRLHHLATAFGDQLKQVRAEDGEALADANLRFDCHAVIGGQLADDDDPSLFLVYPEGNWIEATEDAPYFAIGRTSYGKPILDRLLTYDTPLPQAVALAYLAFDSTRASVTDVEFPIDVIVHDRGDRSPRRHRFDVDDLAEAHAFWHQRLLAALEDFPMAWAKPMWAEAGRPT